MLSLREAPSHVHQEMDKCKDVHCSIVYDHKEKNVYIFTGRRTDKYIVLESYNIDAGVI